MHRLRRRHLAPYAFALFLVAPCVSGCRPHATAAHDHDDAHHHDEDHHDEEGRAIVLTLWVDGYEWFIEYPPPVVGQAFTFVIHVTRLSDGAPRRTGELRIELDSPSGARRVETLPKVARDGIYLPELALAEGGDWQIALELPGEARIALPPVKVSADAHAAVHASIPAELDGIVFLKEQQWRLATLTQEVGRRVMQERIAVPGVVRAVPARRGVVSPPVAGRLEAPEGGRLPALGERVEAGQLVGAIQPPDYELALRRAELRGAEQAAVLELQRAERSYERVRVLHEREARSERELEEADFDLQDARARLEAARASLAALEASPGAGQAQGVLTRFELRAPVGGVVQRIGATLGEAVEPGREIVVLLDSSHVLIEAHPSPDQLAAVDPTLQPTATHHAAPGEVGEIDTSGARLIHVSAEIIEPGHTVPVVYELENTEGALRIGELVTVALATGAQREVLAIPDAALVDLAGEAVAYVQIGGETFEQRHLRLGARADGWVEVLEGLALGERLVVRRPYTIRLASASGSVPVHSH